MKSGIIAWLKAHIAQVTLAGIDTAGIVIQILIFKYPFSPIKAIFTFLILILTSADIVLKLNPKSLNTEHLRPAQQMSRNIGLHHLLSGDSK